jgi:CBS domain-containing protein
MGNTKQPGERLDNIGSILQKSTSGSTLVRMVLQRKAHRDVSTIGPKVSVYDALHLMATRNIGALIVLDGDRVTGVISERDYARKVILAGKASRETRVEEIMGTPVVTVTPATTVAECMALMTSRFLRHLPVVEEGSLVGLVSIGDIVKSLFEEQEQRIGKMEAYISGGYPA